MYTNAIYRDSLGCKMTFSFFFFLFLLKMKKCAYSLEQIQAMILAKHKGPELAIKTKRLYCNFDNLSKGTLYK